MINENNFLSQPPKENCLNFIKEHGLSLEPDMITELTDQSDINGDPIKSKVFWLKNKPENSSREGKLFFPVSVANSTLVCFYAGTPGDNITDFEQKYVSGLTNNGYLVWVPRHNGTRIDNDANSRMIGSLQAVNAVTNNGRNTVGKKLDGYYDEFSKEPAADIKIFAEQESIKDIILIGHSFGATSALSSIEQLAESKHPGLEKVKKIIALSPLLDPGTEIKQTGDFPGTRFKTKDIVKGELEASKIFFNFNKVLTEKELCQELETVFNIKEYADKLLQDKIEMISILSPTDKYLTFESFHKFASRQKRGLFITDLTHSGIKPDQINQNEIFGAEFLEPSDEIIAAANSESKIKYGGSQHSLPNLTPETLLRLLELRVTGKHEVALKSES